jgi:hypothetical protein
MGFRVCYPRAHGDTGTGRPRRRQAPAGRPVSSGDAATWLALRHSGPGTFLWAIGDHMGASANKYYAGSADLPLWHSSRIIGSCRRSARTRCPIYRVCVPGPGYSLAIAPENPNKSQAPARKSSIPGIQLGLNGGTSRQSADYATGEVCESVHVPDISYIWEAPRPG